MSDKVQTAIVAGMTEGALNWTKKQVEDLANKFQNRDLIFLEDERNIDLVKGVKRLPEWKMFSEYIDDKEVRKLYQMGMSLRHLENDSERLQDLRKKINHKFGKRGLHIAQFIQNGVIRQYIIYLMKAEYGKADIKNSINELVTFIERDCFFIQGSINVERTIEKIRTRILAISPPLIILFASGFAIKKEEKIIKEIEKVIDDYEIVEIDEKEKKTRKKTVFIIRQ